jgi:DNA-binding XRE family transcriptional regulator
MSTDERHFDVMAAINLRLRTPEYRRGFGEEYVKLELGLALVKARKTAKLTQEQLAERAGVSQAYIAKLERGLANPTIAQVGGLLALMGLELEFKVKPMGALRERPRERVQHKTKQKVAGAA